VKGTKKLWRMEIEWADSTVLSEGWRRVSDITGRRERRGVIRCLSVGFVLADDDLGITLAGSIHSGEAAGVVHIPAGAILKRRRLV
jgi:hypothetical protein